MQALPIFLFPWNLVSMGGGGGEEGLAIINHGVAIETNRGRVLNDKLGRKFKNRKS